MRCLIAIYDGELKYDRWHPPVLEALRVLPLAVNQQCERIRVERLGGALIAEFSVADLWRHAAARGYAIQPERRTVPDVDWELHRPFWPGVTSDSNRASRTKDD